VPFIQQLFCRNSLGLRIFAHWRDYCEWHSLPFLLMLLILILILILIFRSEDGSQKDQEQDQDQEQEKNQVIITPAVASFRTASSFGIRVAMNIATKSRKAPRYQGAPGTFQPFAGSMKYAKVKVKRPGPKIHARLDKLPIAP
jgi:hypothetical protein